MGKNDLITKDYALYVVHYFASMQTWSKEDILSEIDRKIKEADEDVVRCKDCKHYGTGLCAMDTYAFDVVEEGFCSYGERKEATP